MKKYLALLIAMLMALTLLPAAVAEEEPVTVDMFYVSSRPMNEFTDMTRAYVRDTIGVAPCCFGC